MEKLFVLRVLRFFCPHHLYEEIEGDLIQRFRLKNCEIALKTLLVK